MAGKNGVTTDVNELKDELKQAIDKAAVEAEDVATVVAADVARELRQKADDVRKGMVRTLNDSALKLREQAREDPADVDAQKKADEIAKQIERAASYLSTHSVDDIRKDAEETVKKNSTLILAVVLIVGVIIGLLMRNGDRDCSAW
ncbi:MAG: hypothetical protein IPK19_03785 [Chloroflexi bacterium]|nr:hypothetical protein [Chloroflexota bacterium]